MSDDPRDSEAPSEPSLLDVLVFAPIDAAFGLLGDPRGAANRGRERVERAMRQARALGELTVRFGTNELRRRTEPRVEAARESAPPAPTSPRPAAGPPPNDVIADYDALSASQIVPLLAGLDAAERARVAAYEQAARGRQTILQRLAQLDSASG